MQRLPALATDRAAWRLPLSEHTASILAEALLIEPDHERRRLIAGALGEDPALALWTICRAGSIGEAELASSAAAAAWLAERLPVVLRWAEPHRGENPPDEKAALERWGCLAANGIATAQVAAELARGDRQLVEEEACLLGLVHGAIDWLSLSGTPVTLDDCLREKTCLPPWLVHQLRRLEAGTAEPQSPAAVVAEAIAILKENEHQPAEVRLERDPSEYRSRADKAGRRWLSTASGAGRRLRSLAAKLARLHELETDFQQTLLHEKLASLREFTYGASHELNNPLTNISSRAQSLLRKEKDAERRRKLATIHSHAMRAHEMIAEMALFARPPKLSPEPVDVIELIDGLIEELAEEARDQGVRLQRTAAGSLPVISADATQLSVALRAVCLNAIEAMRHGGLVEVAAREIPPGRQNGRHPARIEIAVHDTGRGLDQREQRHLFDPFFSGREAGRGLGFGLSKCWQIITAHGGRIEVKSRPDDGTTVIVQLPSETVRSETDHPQREGYSP